MKEGIHPQLHQTNVSCAGCGNTFTTGSTVADIRINVCSQCHPFYTGKQRFVDAEGRVDRFKRKYAKNEPAKAEAAAKA